MDASDTFFLNFLKQKLRSGEPLTDREDKELSYLREREDKELAFLRERELCELRTKPGKYCCYYFLIYFKFPYF